MSSVVCPLFCQLLAAHHPPQIILLASHHGGRADFGFGFGSPPPSLILISISSISGFIVSVLPALVQQRMILA